MQSDKLTPPPEYRFSGTIVGVEDNKSLVWADSEWRSLKVNEALVTLPILFFYFLSPELLRN